MRSFDFWFEIKHAWYFLVRYPQTILIPLIPALLFSLANFLTGRGRLTWITSLLQSGLSTILLLVGAVLAFLSLAFLIALIWDYQHRSTVDFSYSWQIITGRWRDVLIVSLIVGFLIAFFSLWFIFPGLFLAFLLMFTLPATVIEGYDPFASISTSFRLAVENVGECFTFFIICLFFLLIGYLIVWLLGFIPIVGIILNIIFLAGLITYLSALLTRFYLSLTRY